ncbi:hypothetical protein GGF44_004366 [Coemansia sp. RSA 1694]|nr:hypothetical protein GGF38_002802 [Coemansia sp. RSA 25]KAJ2628975.1 hypothetical protein GGF44_004366 [Coemansia sp. RSA 1694]
MRLSNESLAAILDKPATAVIAAELRDKGITHIDDISEYSQLRKLDLSNNKIASSEGLDGLRQLKCLAHANLSNNALEDLDFVENMQSIGVLNVSSTKIKRISRNVAKCSELKAIILGNNAIKTIEHIDGLTKLNTLVISHNQVDVIPSMPKLRELTKISAAHNRIKMVPDLTVYPVLKEVRLNDNKIASVPENIRSCTSLRVIDLGNNLMEDWVSIAPLESLVGLDNLNLKGNPICAEKGYRERVVKMIPSLRVLDGERFDQQFLKRKEKRKLKESGSGGSGGAVEAGGAAAGNKPEGGEAATVRPSARSRNRMQEAGSVERQPAVKRQRILRPQHKER